MIKAIMVLIAAVTLSYGLESKTYLLNRSDFPGDQFQIGDFAPEYCKFVDAGRNNIVEAEWQYSCVTHYIISKTGNIALFQVSAKDQYEQAAFDGLQANGLFDLIEMVTVDEVYSPRHGGFIKQEHEVVVRDLTAAEKADLYSVKITTH